MTVAGTIQAAQGSIAHSGGHDAAGRFDSRLPQAEPPLDWFSPEIDCLQNILPRDILRAAEARARPLGTGADRVLIAAGHISEEEYLSHLSAHTNIPLENFEIVVRSDCRLSDEKLVSSIRDGQPLKIERDGSQTVIVNPSGYVAKTLAELAASQPETLAQFRLTTKASLYRFAKSIDPFLSEKAARGLCQQFPQLSAAPQLQTKTAQAVTFIVLATAIAAINFMPFLAFEFFGVLLSAWFLAFNTLRLVASLSAQDIAPPQKRRADGDLPVYTVIAALYREAASVGRLIESLGALDYPVEKLDIKIVLESDDAETRDAIARLQLSPCFEILVVPDGSPRTKPRALNYALEFARGDFIAVYDAEDRPEPNQLRAALDAFRLGGENIVCVQASLCIDNTDDGWLARMFTAEYAGQFDAVLPGLAKFRLPLPLGGSSNHFRANKLCEIGGWDAYNVTEDADLGFRIARSRLRSVTFASTTLEEAPALPLAWLKQRTRWMKGWFQTWAVHMRSPRQLIADAGIRGFLALNILIGGNVMTALTYPLLLLILAWQIIAVAYQSALAPWGGSLVWLHVSAFVLGSLMTITVNAIGLVRRGLLREAWILVLTPLHWILLSAAAFRALWQIMQDDTYRWEKTEHGLAKTSRLANAQAGAVNGTGVGAELLPVTTR